MLERESKAYHWADLGVNPHFVTPCLGGQSMRWLSTLVKRSRALVEILMTRFLMFAPTSCHSDVHVHGLADTKSQVQSPGTMTTRVVLFKGYLRCYNTQPVAQRNTNKLPRPIFSCLAENSAQQTFAGDQPNPI